MKVYLDNAATTRVADEVFEAMKPFFCKKYGNPSSIHSYGREARAAIEKSRKKMAGYLNTSPGEIFFTSGGTESANMIINGAVKTHGVKNIITSRIEHHCVLHPVEALQKEGKVKVDYVNLDEKGNVQLESLSTLLSSNKEKTLVCLMYANNEIGNLTDIEQAGAICKEHDALFFSDTVQAVSHFTIDLQKIHVDYISGSAHKFHGPKGVGFAYIRNEAMIRPMLLGGSQERNLRAGTEDLPGIVGMEKAMELAYENLEQEQSQVEGLKHYFYEKLKKEIPGIEVNGNLGDNSLYTVLSISFPPNDKSAFLIYNLDMNEIAVSAGSACSSGSNVGSHVIHELKKDPARSNVRFSFSRYNTQEELDYVVEKLKELFLVEAS